MERNQNHRQFDVAKRRFQELKKQSPRIAGTVAVAFFKEGFRLQGQRLNGSLKPWKKRSPEFNKRKGAAVLTKTGTLQRDLRYRTAGHRVGIISAMPYSQILNDGGKIPITPRMRRFFWAMYYQEMGRVLYSVKKKSMTKASVKHNTDAEIWKNMALTKKTHIEIEARPFLYDTRDLIAALNNEFERQIQNLFK